MNRKTLWLVLIATAVPVAVAAQAVPEGSPADRLRPAWRRVSTFRNDPFRHVALPHWGVVFSVGGRAENNTLNFEDLGAFLLLNRNDDVLIGDIIDAFGLVPRGAGVGGEGQVEGGIAFGGPVGDRVRIGVSAQTRGYGAFQLDDAAVALLRDGNLDRAEFTLGTTRGAALTTLEGGAHALVTLGPIGGVDGARVVVGAGARYVRPMVYASGQSLLADGGRVLVSEDSVTANLEAELLVTRVDEFSDLVANRGSGIAGDFLLRLEWPTNGLAFEAMAANLGSVTVERVERRTLTADLATTRLDTVLDVLDTLGLQVQDTGQAEVTLPRIVRFGASAWANRILQLDVTATLPVTGAFATPLAVDIGSTWRLAPALPVRLGLVLGGHQGVGYTAGVALESRHLLFRVAGESLGGLFGRATGAGARFEIGVFF